MQIKNIKQLRDSLLENYELAKSKKMPLDMANSLSNVAGKILHSAKLQMDYKSLTNNNDEIDFFNKED